tara:strand:+ start:1520 stop:2473 length:954 start_codon:yes stop_codon:yes gene_type:complete
MLVGPRDEAVNVHALVSFTHGGARILPRPLPDGRYAVSEALLDHPDYAAASDVLSGWSVETPTSFANPATHEFSPMSVRVDGKYMWQIGRRSALTMPDPDVFRFQIRANDFGTTHDSENKNRRGELVAEKTAGFGAVTVWTSFCLILGDATGLGKTAHGMVWQWHSVDTTVARSPILSVNVASDGLKIRTASDALLYGGSGTGTQHPENGIFVIHHTESRPAKGVKTHIVMQATFGESGHLNAWVNGSQVVDADTAIGYYGDLSDGSGRTVLGYPHFGLYTANQPDTDTVYIANPEWGTVDLSARIASPLTVPDLTW